MSSSKDPYHWADDNELHITQDHLVDIIRTKRKKFMIIDTRDDDRAGGHIISSHHFPDSRFDLLTLASLIQKNKTEIVIFHCMESARRGPRSAFKLHNEYCIQNDEYADQVTPQEMCKKYPDKGIPRICILRGGADQWIRRFHKDSNLVEGFDDDYWGFYPDVIESAESHVDDNNIKSQTTMETENNSNDIAIQRMHKLYSRPSDQPRTEWSLPGKDAIEP